MSKSEPKLMAKLFTPHGVEEGYEFPLTPTAFDKEMMELALGEARLALQTGDNPVGAVLVNNHGKSAARRIYKAHSTEFSEQDLTAHAEYNAYAQAKQDLGRNLGACAVYVTAEPCIACSYFLYKGGIGSIFFGARRQDAAGFFRQRSIDFENVLQESGRTILVVSGLLKNEAVGLMTPENRKY